MISVAEADRILADEAWSLPAEPVPLPESYGRILRLPLRSDRDLPPYDRATMDGIAVRSAALAAGSRRFAVEAEAVAGQPAVNLSEKPAGTPRRRRGTRCRWCRSSARPTAGPWLGCA